MTPFMRARTLGLTPSCFLVLRDLRMAAAKPRGLGVLWSNMTKLRPMTCTKRDASLMLIRKD